MEDDYKNEEGTYSEERKNRGKKISYDDICNLSEAKYPYQEEKRDEFIIEMMLDFNHICKIAVEFYHEHRKKKIKVKEHKRRSVLNSVEERQKEEILNKFSEKLNIEIAINVLHQIMPNGKELQDCTAEELGYFGQGYSRITAKAREIGKSEELIKTVFSKLELEKLLLNR